MGQDHTDSPSSATNFGQSTIDPLLVASRIGDLWNQRKFTNHAAPPIQFPITTNENKVMMSQVSAAKEHGAFKGSRWNLQEDFFPLSNSNFISSLRPDMAPEGRNTPQLQSWSSNFTPRQEPQGILQYKRRDAKVYLDKARREWKVEWNEDNSLKMKRFSCKRWGKAKAKASAMEYYMLVLRGMPLHPNRPFFSQIRKLMDRKEQILKNKPPHENSDLEQQKQSPTNNVVRVEECGWYPPMNSRHKSRDQMALEDDDGSINLAWACGNRTVDALCSAMNVSLGRNPVDEGIIPFYPNTFI